MFPGVLILGDYTARVGDPSGRLGRIRGRTPAGLRGSRGRWRTRGVARHRAYSGRPWNGYGRWRQCEQGPHHGRERRAGRLEVDLRPFLLALDQSGRYKLREFTAGRPGARPHPALDLP